MLPLLCAHIARSKYWRRAAEEGRPAWQKIVVALIADGIGPMDTEVLDVLATVGAYQDGVLKKAVDDNQTVAHIFEVSERGSMDPLIGQYTTQLSIDSKPQLVQPHPGDPNNLVSVNQSQTNSTGPGPNHLLPQAGKLQKDQLAQMAL